LDNFLWIACQSQFHPSADDLREYGKKLWKKLLPLSNMIINANRW
jgi:hypothetical protein